MANKAMKPRHWQRIAELTMTEIPIEREDFTLRNILEAPLLKFKEDIEVLVGCSMVLPLVSIGSIMPLTV